MIQWHSVGDPLPKLKNLSRREALLLFAFVLSLNDKEYGNVNYASTLVEEFDEMLSDDKTAQILEKR